MQITPLTSRHLLAASALATADHTQEKTYVPDLPQRDAGFYLPRLEQLLSRGPGAAAVDEKGELLGYLIGSKVPNFRSNQLGIHVPEWANAATGPDRFTLIRQLYQYLSALWVENGCFSHGVTLYAHDELALQTWFRTAFGMICGDAVRDLEPVSDATAEDIEIRPATVADIPMFLPLVHEHQRYYPAAPLFMPLLKLSDRDYFVEWLGHQDHVFWLALDQGEPIGYFESTPSHPRASSIIYDAGTYSICSAFVRPGVRKHGVGTALLARIVEWAREHGYERCAVDYETHNPNGSRFWEKHFRPVAYSVMRQVDERVAWGHAERPEQSIW